MKPWLEMLKSRCSDEKKMLQKGQKREKVKTFQKTYQKLI